MYDNIRSWAEALIAWGEDFGLVNHFTHTHCEVVLPGGRLYLHRTGQNSWRVSTLKDCSMDEDHIVVDETADRRLRVRRGPAGKLTEVQYDPGVEDSQKLTRASFDVTKLLAGPLRTNFLDRFVWGGPNECLV